MGSVKSPMKICENVVKKVVLISAYIILFYIKYITSIYMYYIYYIFFRPLLYLLTYLA